MSHLEPLRPVLEGVVAIKAARLAYRAALSAYNTAFDEGRPAEVAPLHRAVCMAHAAWVGAAQRLVDEGAADIAERELAYLPVKEDA